MDALVIVPQAFEHDDAVIVGSRNAMICLRQALERAIATDTVAVSDACDPGDGEGFSVMVIPTDEPLRPWYMDDEPGQVGEWNEFYGRVIRPHTLAVAGFVATSRTTKAAAGGMAAMPDRQVRVRCLPHVGGATCPTCGPIDPDTDSGEREYLATLRDPEAEASMADGEKAIAFVRAIFAGGYERGDWDGGALQELGVRTGVLVEVPVTEPCGEACACMEWDDVPGTCYRFALSTPAPEATHG